MSNYAPTSEQQAIYDAVQAGHDVVAAAGAGAGKTSTIVGIAERTDEPGMLITFNKAIARDAAPKLKSTKWQAKTAHSLAFGWMVRQDGLKARFDQDPPNYRTLRSFIGARDFRLNGKHSLPANQIVRAVKDAHEHYCNSADEQLTERHVRRALPPLPEGIDGGQLLAYVLPLAKRYSADALSAHGSMKFSFNEMLKLYQLSHPQLPVSTVGYDEAQDANPVILDIVRRQRCQRIVVGDSNQQIYEWRGAVDALDRFSEMPGVKTLGLTQSFRFGPAIAEIANLFLTALDSRINDEPFRIKGFDKIDSQVVGSIETPNAVLCRSNAGCLAEAMDYLEEGKQVAIVGGGEDIRRFAQGARDLMTDPKPAGKGSNHPELVAFNTWDEVLEYIESGDADASFKRLAQIVSKLGVNQILQILNSLVSEEEADVVISTAHKAKGREWATVRIAGDFKPPEEGNEASKGELRLAYVAVTRAMQELDLGGLSWIRSYLGSLEQEEI